jgi:N-acetylglutamate synthase-like GNAT family acetyltransferase
MSPTAIEPVIEDHYGEFVISTDRARLNLETIYRFLTDCYWAYGIPKETVARSIQHSLCFGVYKAGEQVGFARVISDYATYAYLGDVFVLGPYRGEGLSKRLMQCVVAHPWLQGLRRWSLLTRDAHGLYAQFGFTPLKTAERWMEIHNPNVYAGSEPVDGSGKDGLII